MIKAVFYRMEIGAEIDVIASDTLALDSIIPEFAIDDDIDILFLVPCVKAAFDKRVDIVI